jgi:hypothetical protein
MLNKIVSIKNTNAIFLAIVLVAGVITIASPFSAFAQAYHGYEKEYNSYDQYKPEMRYGKSEPIPEYNDYYEPMKQQQQSSYDNNNDGYDNNQKIPYNNGYEDMNKYSTYPTKDKKYVCQIGQFEGFFVESLEFCKLNIPAGPQGPEGPPGQINFTNTYQVVGNGANTGETPSRAFSVAFCDPGDIVLEGGGGVASFFDEGLGNVFLLIREPVNEGNGYRVGGVAANTGFDSSAICIDNPPLR